MQAQLDFLKDVVLRHLKEQYGEDRAEWKAACKRALSRGLPDVWQPAFREVLKELEA